jgi:hypothetical protein
MPRQSESLALIPLVESKDYGSAGIDAVTVNMGKLHSITCLCTFGAITGNTTLIVYNGATAGAKTTAVAFTYRMSSAVYAAALSDQYGNKIAVAATGLVLTGATFVHRAVVVEIDSDQMTDGKPFLTLSFDSVATVLLLGVVGLGMPRYPGHTIPSVIV